jgi:hypothetical protein
MPTYIYPNSIDFSSYSMKQYYQINNISLNNQSLNQCTLNDIQCKILEIPLSDQINNSNSSCLSDSFTAGSCCSLLTENFFVNSSYESKNNPTEFLIDLTDGTVSCNSDFMYFCF